MSGQASGTHETRSAKKKRIRVDTHSSVEDTMSHQLLSGGYHTYRTGEMYCCGDSNDEEE